MNTSASQREQILEFLKQGNELTPLDALERFQCFRLAARINDLRSSGHDIITEDRALPNGKRVAAYRMGTK